jgi:hypothetical protein
VETESHSASFSVRCSRSASAPRTIYIEPWGEDYWLFPGDELTVSAFSRAQRPEFSLVESDTSTQIHVDGFVHDYFVAHGEGTVGSGFQRAQNLGTADYAFTIIGRGIVIGCKRPWQVNVSTGDELRLIIPRVRVLRTRVLGLEHMNAGPDKKLANPWGLFLGKLEVPATDIPTGTPVYRLE